MKWALRVLGIVLLAAASAYAFAFLIILNAKSARATYRIETREAQPDYVFVLDTEAYRLDQGWRWEPLIESRFAEIAPVDPLVLELKGWPEEGQGADEVERQDQAQLAIVSRTVAERYTTAKECFDACAYDESPSFYETKAVPPWYGSRSKITVTYRVQPRKSGDGLELVQTSWSPLWQWAAVPILTGILGVWFWRNTHRFRDALSPN